MNSDPTCRMEEAEAETGMVKEVGTLVHDRTRTVDTMGTPAEAIPGP